MNKLWTFALDVMSGECCLHELILGAMEAANDFNVRIILIGDQSQILREQMFLKSTLNLDDSLVEVCHASDAIQMNESPSKACLKKKNLVS